jgi:tRNA-specific 2-thiouridylase
VVDKRMATNELVIGYDRPETAGLYASRVILTNLSAAGPELPAQARIEARPRYRAPRVAIDFVRGDDGTAEVVFAEAQRALAAGQICALYEGPRLLGGGVFAQIG